MSTIDDDTFVATEIDRLAQRATPASALLAMLPPDALRVAIQALQSSADTTAFGWDHALKIQAVKRVLLSELDNRS